MKILITCITLSFTFVSAIAQQTYTIKTVDVLTEKPIDSVAIYLRGQEITSSNAMGFFQVTANQGDSLIFVHSRYEQTLLLLPGQTRFLVSLKKKPEHLEFSGGVVEYFRYLQAHLIYPFKAIKNKSVASVYVEFTVNEKGKAEIKNIHGDDKDYFTAACQKAYNTIPADWNPDYQGKTFIQPIVFLIQGMDEVPDKELPEYINPDFTFAKITVKTFSSTRIQTIR